MGEAIVTRHHLEVVSMAARMAYRYDPVPFLLMRDLLHARLLESYRVRGNLLQMASGYLFAAATTGYWWFGLPCLPLSLAGAHFARASRAGRLHWSSPVVSELGCRRLFDDPSTPPAIPVERGEE